MTSATLYSFTDVNQPKNRPLHFLYHSDNTRREAADVISELAGVAERVWRGEEVDLSRLRLPHVDYVMSRETRGDANKIRPVPVRYEVEMVDGQIVMVQELHHAPQGVCELEARRERAQEALARVEAEMKKARLAPTYQVSVSGTLEDIRQKSSR